MKRRGFSVVELLIIIIVMGILLTLAVVNLRTSQINGRDSERKADIESIATHLETFYTTGTDGSIEVGRYPSLAMLANTTTLFALLRDAKEDSFIAPSVADDDDDLNEHIIGTDGTMKVATNNTQTTSGVAPQPTISTYVYQPLKSDGSLCETETEECRSFNLYYMLELDETIYITKSKNR